MENSILIVDDEEAIRESMHEFLVLAGYKVLTAANAEEAIDLLSDNHFDVVITDITLGEIDGLQLTDFIKKNYTSAIIVITGYYKDYSYEEAVNKGASDFVFKPLRFEELHLRLKRVLKERLLSKERKQMVAELQTLAITDGLTNLYNSRHFNNQIEMEINRSVRYKHRLALLLFDIDYFKKFNDSFGHVAGDKILARIGQIVISLLRTMDSAYRYGGEEFTIILPETSGEEAKTVAKRVRETIGSEIFVPKKGKTISITVSVGVTEYFINEGISSFVQRADKAMYVSKKTGRNRVTSLYVEQP